MFLVLLTARELKHVCKFLVPEIGPQFAISSLLSLSLSPVHPTLSSQLSMLSPLHSTLSSVLASPLYSAFSLLQPTLLHSLHSTLSSQPPPGPPFTLSPNLLCLLPSPIHSPLLFPSMKSRLPNKGEQPSNFWKEKENHLGSSVMCIESCSVARGSFLINLHTKNYLPVHFCHALISLKGEGLHCFSGFQSPNLNNVVSSHFCQKKNIVSTHHCFGGEQGGSA